MRNIYTKSGLDQLKIWKLPIVLKTDLENTFFTTLSSGLISEEMKIREMVFSSSSAALGTVNKKINAENFDENAKKEFLNGAKIAYENIVTSFSSGNLKSVKELLDKKVYNQFDEAIKSRNANGQISETTFIGINSAEIKNHENKKGFLEVTVNFVSEIISCVKDKNNNILTGDPKKIKKVFDTWKFSKQVNSTNPNWLLIDTENW